MAQQIVMKHIIEQKLKPIMISLFQRIKEGGLTLAMDGVPAYNPKAQFVAGKVINQSCFTALEFVRTEESIDILSDIIQMMSTMEMETWGILHSITGLYRLHQQHLLEKVVDPQTLERLKKALDWRTFINEDDHYALISKPTNYYGVAFGIARYRELLGWEPEKHSTHLLDRLIEHIDQYSGEFCYMDETPGDGRFDRYSLLVPSELASMLLTTGIEVPVKIRVMLRNSCRMFLQMANEDGSGFPYGRSIGAYGDTAILEVFSVAAKLGGILTDDEMEIAYGYCTRIVNTMVDFWYDQEMDSINMWDKGRRTDDYRNKNRILGENLSLNMQVINAYEHWKAAGFEDRQICPDYAQRIAALPAYTYVPFAEGEYKRGAAIVRDGNRIWTLPLINGAHKYYDKDAYLHIPYQNMVLMGVPECNHGQLIPQLIMENGDIYMPLVYTTEITPVTGQGCMVITCEYDGLCRMGNGIMMNQALQMKPVASKGPEKVPDTNAVVTYGFEKNAIHRKDKLIVNNGNRVIEARLVLLTYSEEPQVNGCSVTFGQGSITGMTAAGFDTCEVYSATSDGNYDTPRGRLAYEVVWSRKKALQANEFQFSWTITYQ